MPDCSPLAPVIHPPWLASLRLRFERADAATTRLMENTHRGPLRVQKALYLEGPGVCHAIVLHPPGGVVGGDRLAIDIAAGAGAHALLTTPGAAKWYRANGKVSSQWVQLQVGPGAACEWLPNESIFYDGADVDLHHDVVLAAGARYIGSDILCFGRRAANERFTRGAVRQHSSVRLDGKLLWWEQGLMTPAALASRFGLNGRSVCATLMAVGPVVPAALLATLRALHPDLGVTQMKAVLVARFLGDDSETARQVLVRVWQHLRPHLLGCAGTVPRIWHT
ncbi:MAG: urease accessory protein UreD [Pseudomonadota bacterium]|nr:urease accessory protein UreD [Pseudomonadota bacterium]